jgi:hypothetical protein
MRIACLVLLHAALSLCRASSAHADEPDALVLRAGLVTTNDVEPSDERWWVVPVRRLALRGALAEDPLRPFSTLARPRELAGGLAVTCERRAGEPCGDGGHLYSDLDAAAGYGPWLDAGTRIRAVLRDTRIELDRLFVRGRYNAFALEVGRDALAFGVSTHRQLGWGTNPPPLDHIRLSASRLELTPALHASAHYVVGALRAPQTYPGNLVTIAYAQLAIADTVDVGLMQLLQLGGDGAAELGVWDFVAEHIRRRDFTASETDSSNRRFGGNVSVQITELDNLRMYYELVFEDIRRARWIDAVRYDADHLIGAELSFLTLEWYQTGVRSHEHMVRTTGFTHRGLVVGAPLGPDARSLYVAGRVVVDELAVMPWLELAQLSSDHYEIIPFGPINRIADGEDEERWRAAITVEHPLYDGVWLRGDAIVERINDAGFVTGTNRTAAAVGAAIIWFPKLRAAQ